jgi:hypothetical protein
MTPIGQTCACEPMTWLYFVLVQSVFVFVELTLAMAFGGVRRGAPAAAVRQAAGAAARGGGLYKPSSVAPQLEKARLVSQPLNLKCAVISWFLKICFFKWGQLVPLRRGGHGRRRGQSAAAQADGVPAVAAAQHGHAVRGAIRGERCGGPAAASGGCGEGRR